MGDKRVIEIFLEGKLQVGCSVIGRIGSLCWRLLLAWVLGWGEARGSVFRQVRW